MHGVLRVRGDIGEWRWESDSNVIDEYQVEYWLMIKRPYLFISAGGNTAITGTTCQKMKPSVKNVSLTMYLVGKNTTSRKVENNNYAKKG